MVSYTPKSSVKDLYVQQTPFTVLLPEPIVLMIILALILLSAPISPVFWVIYSKSGFGHDCGFGSDKGK